MYLSISGEKHHSKRTTEFMSVLRNIRPSGVTDMALTLGKILEEYTLKLDAQNSRNIFGRKKTVRQLSLYVLTDAKWEPGCDVESVIRNAVTHIKQKYTLGIQFISFGTERSNLLKLKELDDELDLKYDVVDTESHDGNVYKLLLGGINSMFDKGK